MISRKQLFYLVFTLLVYLLLTLPGWIREYSNFSSSGALGTIVPIIIILKMLIWASFHNLVLIDKLAVHGHYIKYAGSLIVGLAVMAFLQQSLSRPYNFYWAYINIFIHTALCTALYMSIAYIDQKREFYKQSLLSREIELNLLKAQLNPHFLFNALNNIYSYNLENDKKGNDLILKLSQLMRYIVEVNNKPFVTLNEEIQFISNYVSLEKERLGYRCDIEFNVQCPNTDVKIAPLLFFPLIENAFKHGAATNKKSRIEISLIQSTDSLDVFITNSLSEQIKNGSTHVGITNVKRRLELLHSGKHLLQLEEKGDRFSTSLKIQLA